MSRGGGLGSGHATFASCNKAGSIPHYTAFLKTNPGNFEALKWRGRAYSIIGQMTDAAVDFRAAERQSPAPYNSLARSELAFIEGNVQQGVDILIDVIKQHPQCGEAWSELGSCIYQCGSADAAIEPIKTSIALGNASGESSKPWHYWAKDSLAEIYYVNGDVKTAEIYYSSAVQACPTFTKAHIGVGRCNVINNNMAKAEGCYRRARELNPKIAPWTTFQEFVTEVKAYAPQRISTSAPQPQRQSTTSNSYFGSAVSAVTSMFNSALGYFTTTPQSTQSNAVNRSAVPAVAANSSSYNAPPSRPSSTRQPETNQSSTTPSSFSNQRVSSAPAVGPSSTRYRSDVAANSSSYRAPSRSQHTASNQSSADSNSSYARYLSSTKTSVSSIQRPSSAPAVRRYYSYYSDESKQQTSNNHVANDDSTTGRNHEHRSDVTQQYTISGSRSRGAKKNDTGAAYGRGSSGNGGGNHNRGSGYSRGGGGGRGGGSDGGDGNGSDGDGDDSVWKKFTATKPTTARSVTSNKTYQQVGTGKYWLSRDKASHGGAHSSNTGSHFKLFVEKGNTLDFVGSVPITIFRKDIRRSDVLLQGILDGEPILQDFDIIQNKRESHAGEQIKKKDLKIVQQKPKKRN